jgi:hypothetical protein
MAQGMLIGMNAPATPLRAFTVTYRRATHVSFKNPTFQDRIGSAAEAKKKALEQLRARPPADPRKVAERQAAAAEKQARAVQKAAEKKAAQQAVKDAKAAEAAAPPPRTEAERKAERDARYAARKARR